MGGRQSGSDNTEMVQCTTTTYQNVNTLGQDVHRALKYILNLKMQFWDKYLQTSKCWPKQWNAKLSWLI